MVKEGYKVFGTEDYIKLSEQLSDIEINKFTYGVLERQIDYDYDYYYLYPVTIYFNNKYKIVIHLNNVYDSFKDIKERLLNCLSNRLSIVHFYSILDKFNNTEIKKACRVYEDMLKKLKLP